MRALTVEELGYVSGGNVNGPMFTKESWQQLSASGELIIVRASAPNTGGGGVQFFDQNEYVTAFSQTSLGRMGDAWGGMSNSARGAVLGGALIAVGSGLMLAASLTPQGALVWGIVAASTVNYAGFATVTAGAMAGIGGMLADEMAKGGG